MTSQQQASSLQAQALQEQESALSLLRALETQLLEETKPPHDGASQPAAGVAQDLLKSIEGKVRSAISTQESAARLLMQASQAQLTALTMVQQLPPPAAAPPPAAPVMAPPPMTAAPPPAYAPPPGPPPSASPYGLPLPPSDPAADAAAAYAASQYAPPPQYAPPAQYAPPPADPYAAYAAAAAAAAAV